MRRSWQGEGRSGVPLADDRARRRAGDGAGLRGHCHAERFAKSRAVGAYVGLTSRRWQSGEMDYSGRISKHGDAMLRSLLYEAANSLLTVVRRAHPLKDWARRIRKRTSHKKACVALARKLAVILHRMLITGEAFRWPEKEAATTA